MTSWLFKDRRISRPLITNPYAKAGASAGLYVFFCTIYLLLSSYLAESASMTKGQLATIEIIKGMLFVAITGIVFFAISFARWRHIKKQEETIIAQEKSLLDSERKSVAAICSATLSHDLNNLIMSLFGLIEELKGKEKGDEFLQTLRKDLENATSSLTQLTKRVGSTANKSLPEKEEDLDLSFAIRQLAKFVRKHPDLRSCSIELGDIPHDIVRVKKVLFEEAVLNLLINAGQAAGKEGRVRIHVVDQDDMFLLEVHDNGPGIPDDKVKSVFLPCFTTKPEGTGIGLLAVKMFALSCGGKVVVDRSDLGGALIRIHIPKARNESSIMAMESDEG